MTWKREGIFETEESERISKEKIFCMIKVAVVFYTVALIILYFKSGR